MSSQQVAAGRGRGSFSITPGRYAQETAVRAAQIGHVSDVPSRPAGDQAVEELLRSADLDSDPPARALHIGHEEGPLVNRSKTDPQRFRLTALRRKILFGQYALYG